MHTIIKEVFEMSHAKHKLEEIVEDDDTDFDSDRPGKEPPRFTRTHALAMVF
jgi:hypothetical protein